MATISQEGDKGSHRYEVIKILSLVHNTAVVLRGLNFPSASQISFEILHLRYPISLLLPPIEMVCVVSPRKCAEGLVGKQLKFSGGSFSLRQLQCHYEAICRQNASFCNWARSPSIWKGLSRSPMCANGERKGGKSKGTGRRRGKSWERGSHSQKWVPYFFNVRSLPANCRQ